MEHQGWTFEKDPNKSAEMIAVHSGGQGSIALRMSMARGSSRLEETKPAAGTKDQVNKELQSDRWETEPLVKDKAVSTGTSNQNVPRSAKDLLAPPQESGITKLSKCCHSCFGHEDND